MLFPLVELGAAGSALVTRNRYPSGTQKGWRRTERGRLVYPSDRVMTVHTRAGSWVVSPVSACWLPQNAEYRFESENDVEVYEVLCPGLAKLLPDRCGIVPISKLLRELVFAMERTGSSCAQRSPTEQVLGAIAGQIRVQQVPPLRPPELSSERLQRIARALSANPADSKTLQRWAAELRTTSRTLARAFQREALMTFHEFREQVRLDAAIRRLAAGQSVTSVAYEVGFGSPASFIAAFRRATGVTPGSYFRVLKDPVRRSH
jgi:AraC-like DNA-binding protein